MGESAKGWADKKALEQACGDKYAGLCMNAKGTYLVPWGAPSLNPTEAEVQAEEDMLP